MLSISNLHVTVGDKLILDGLTLYVPAGEVQAGLGSKGAGAAVVGYAGCRRPS